MGAYTLKTRNLVSTWFSLILMVMLILYLLSIELFRDSQNTESIVNLLETPISRKFVDNIKVISFKNRIGSYTIKKENQSWLLQEPRVIPAQKNTINQILKALKNIKIHTIHQLEPINMQSFSLDKPVLEMNLKSNTDKSIQIKVGLINPINNTSYITVSGLDRIFQTNLFEGKLEGLELSDFIDGQVFSMKLDKIKSFKVFHGKRTDAYNNLSFDGQSWQAKKYNSITTENVNKKINSILNIKTHMIIDETDEELKTFIQNYKENPLYRIEVTLQSGKKIEYLISNLIKSIPSLKVDSRQYFLMHASDRPYPYILSKSFLNTFKIKYNDIK